MKRRNFMRFFEAKAYGLQDTKNPLFPSKDRRPVLLLVLGLTALVLLGGMITLGWFIYSPNLRINSLAVNGLSLIPEAQVTTLAQAALDKQVFIFPRDQVWFFKTDYLEAALMEGLPLKTVQVTRSKNALTIDITEGILAGSFRSGEVVYFLDKDGVIVREATAEEKAALPSDLPLITDVNTHTYAVGDSVFSTEEMAGAKAFHEGLLRLGITPTRFIAEDKKLSWLSAESDRPYAILFDSKKDINTQLLVLEAVLKKYVTPEVTPRHYIDVRFGEHAYVR